MVQRQVNIQREVQSLKTTQTVSQQRLLLAQLVELPVNQLLDRINTEMNDNPALESNGNYDGDDMLDAHANPYADSDSYNEDTDSADHHYEDKEKEDRQMALDDALNNIGRDDEDLPVYRSHPLLHIARSEVYAQCNGIIIPMGEAFRYALSQPAYPHHQFRFIVHLLAPVWYEKRLMVFEQRRVWFEEDDRFLWFI